MSVGIHGGFGVHTLVWIGQRFLDDSIYNLVWWHITGHRFNQNAWVNVFWWVVWDNLNVVFQCKVQPDYAQMLKCKDRFYAKISKILIPSLYNCFFRLNTNWIYEKSTCMQTNLQAKVVLVCLNTIFIQLFSINNSFLWMVYLLYHRGLWHSTTLHNSDHDNVLFL